MTPILGCMNTTATAVDSISELFNEVVDSSMVSLYD